MIPVCSNLFSSYKPKSYLIKNWFFNSINIPRVKNRGTKFTSKYLILKIFFRSKKNKIKYKTRGKEHNIIILSVLNIDNFIEDISSDGKKVKI